MSISAGSRPVSAPSRGRATSKPAQKPRPAPVRMIARASGSASASSRAWYSSDSMVGLIALSIWGRFSVIVTTGPVFSYRIAS